MTDGLKARHRAAIIATLAANDRVERAVLFGSRAMGANTITSDVDIALFGQQLTLTDQASLAAACEELPMAQSVDLVLHSAIDNPALVEHIRSDGVEWYRRGGASEVSRAGLGDDVLEGQGWNMGSEWKRLPLCKVTENLDFKRVPVKESDRKPGIYPYYGASGIIDHINSFIFDGEYVLVAEDGENLRSRKSPIAFFARGKFWVNNHAHILSGNRHSDTRFLSYMIESCDVSGYLTGSTIPKLTQGNLDKIEFLIPPLEEQKAIAHILGTLDDKIELNRRMNETLEAMARALFKDWFVDFGPVRAKAEGREAYLPEEIWGLFPDSFEDSELGEIPRGWKLGTISELVDIDPPRKLAKESIAPYLEMKGVTISGHTVTGVYRRKFTSGTKFQLGDTLLARITPCLENGKTALVDFLEDGEIGWGSTEFIVMCGKKHLHNSFVYCLARSEGFRSYAIRNMVGSSGRQRISSNILVDFQMSLPPDYLVDCFSILCRSFLRKISKASAHNLTLSSIQNILLPKLISGELSVAAAEKLPWRIV